MSFYVLAFNIDRDGPTTNDFTKIIEVVVIDNNYKELDYGLFSLNEDSSIDEDIAKMMEEFIIFVCKWEKNSKDDNIELYRVCDNYKYNVQYFINVDINYSYNNLLPLPYYFSRKEYGQVWDTHSLVKGYLMGRHKDTTKGLNDFMKKFIPGYKKDVKKNSVIIAYVFVYILNNINKSNQKCLIL